MVGTVLAPCTVQDVRHRIRNSRAPQFVVRMLVLPSLQPQKCFFQQRMIQIETTHKKLSELVKDPSALRHQHLLGLCEAADDRGDADRSTIILAILTREQERKKWRRIIYTTWPPRGGNSLSVRVQSGPIVHTTPRQRSWNIPQTISLSVFIWPTLHHVTVCNYSTSLGLWVTQNAHNRSLKVHMITHCYHNIYCRFPTKLEGG